MNPLQNARVETGDEYDTTDDEVSDNDDDDSDDETESDLAESADTSESETGRTARLAHIVAATAFADSANPIGAAPPPGHAAAESSASSSPAPSSVSFSPTVSVQDSTETQMASPEIRGQEHTTRPHKARRLTAPVSKPGRKSFNDKQYAIAYKAQEDALEASRRIQRDMYWRRAFKKP